jgi:hypothetical protein
MLPGKFKAMKFKAILCSHYKKREKSKQSFSPNRKENFMFTDAERRSLEEKLFRFMKKVERKIHRWEDFKGRKD